jgi:nicotinate-nucleotide adenylyltransferase
VRLGVIGGSFDPIHIGHLIVAQEACTSLALERMLFVPAGQPPHKLGRAMTDPAHRVEMVQRAIAGNACFSLSRVDVDRPGPCYTVDTIHILREIWGADAEIDFLIGSDMLADLPTWRQPGRLIHLCQVVAVRRPGYQVDLDQLDRRLPGAAAAIQMLDAPTLDISATAIRARVRSGRSIRYLVPEPVEQYIHAQGLYRQ